MKFLELDEALDGAEHRPLRYRLGATLLPVGFDAFGYDLRCCSCGFGAHDQPATCPLCSGRAWELVGCIS